MEGSPPLRYTVPVQLSHTTVIGIVAIVGAGAFAAGRSNSPAPSPIASESTPSTPPASPAAMPMGMGESDEPLPPGHPPMGGATPSGDQLPPGHPHVDPNSGTAATAAPGFEPPPAGEAALDWKAPPRWQSVPNATTMRLATLRVPRAPGDTEDGDLSVTQAGGSVEANVTRWIGQFDAAGQKTAKRTTRRVGALDVTLVEVQGVYSGGMTPDAGAGADRALLGAIVATPGMPYFFKLTGPAKTVLAARAEFDALIASLTAHASH